MLLMMVPMVELEERDTGEFTSALEATQWAADNDLVYVARAEITSSQPVDTGMPFTYKLFYTLSSAPVYNPGDGNPVAAYTGYENVAIEVVAPDGIKLVDNSGNLIANPGETRTIVLGGGSLMAAGSSGTLTFQGVMIDNGLSADGTVYDRLEVSITADVNLSSEETVHFDFDLPVDSSDNATTVTNNCDDSWDIDKTVGSASPAISGSGDGEIATFTYYIEAGKLVGGSISGSASDYDKYGTLNFASGGFTLTDTLPTFERDGVTVLPQSSSISLLDGGGNPVSTVSGGQGETSLAIDAYRTTSLSAAYASVGVAPSATETPFYSKYKVTVSYLLSDLTLPYGSDLEDDPDTFTLNNLASLDYTLVGTASQSASDSASTAWKKTTPPGEMIIRKFIPFNGENQPYDAFWSTVFPGGAQFEVYKAADWDAGSGAPNSGASPVATYNLTVNNSSDTISLEPGTYYVLETQNPTGTTMGPAHSAEIVSGETEAVDYLNNASYGLLTFTKEGPSDSGLTGLYGAQFALTKDGGEVVTATSNIDGSVYMSAPAGDYQLVETYAPAGFVRIDPVDVTIENGVTTDLGSVVDEASTASLTLTKYAVTYENGGGSYAAEDVKSIQTVADPGDFTFTLSWEEREEGVATPHSLENITLTSGGTVTLTGLKRVDADNNWIEYTLTEDAPADSAFAADGAIPTITFDRSHPTSDSASAYDLISGTLKIKKQQEDLGGTSYPAGKTFKLYKKNGSDIEYVGSMTTGSDGVATFDGLSIDDGAGDAIQYYLVEESDDAYAVTYPDSETITVSGESVAAWPVTLDFQKVTDLTATPVINRQKNGVIRVLKTNADGSVALAGGKFKVYTLSGEDKTYLNDANPYTTGADGTVDISPLDLSVTYYVEEFEAPDTYLLGDETTQSADVASPLEVKLLTFQNDRKPKLTLTKKLQNLATGAISAGTGISFDLYEKTGENTFAAVGAVSTLTTNASGVATVYLPDAGDYYLREEYPAGVIPPGVEDGLYAGLTLGDDGFYYYGPVSASRNADAPVTITNDLNRGKIAITKKNAKTPFQVLSGAVFEVRVTPPDGDTATIAALTNLGFTGSGGVYARALTATNSSGLTSIEGLPIYASDGTPLSYAVAETAAPTNYLLSEDELSATFVTADDRVFEMEFSDSPQATLSLGKVGVDKYASKGHEVQLVLAGATMDLYEKIVDGEDITLVYAGSAVSDATGNVSFAALDGLATYVVFERTPPAGYELPDGKSEIESAGALAGTYSSAGYSALSDTYYGLPEHDFASGGNAYAYTTKLVNYIPYAQFKLLKYSSADGTTPLDHAKYALYSSSVSEGEKSFSELMAEGALTLEDYTYETGTESGGTGSFITNPQTYGRVYWLVEIEAPSGYLLPDEVDDRVIGPLTPDGAGWSAGTEYAKNGLTVVSALNTPDPDGGEGTERFLQIEINKILKDAAGATVLGNLPGATFELWLADASGAPVLKITTMTTGLDMGKYSDPAEAAQVAGRAISESFDMAALYADETYGQYIEQTGSEGAYDYSAKFVLKEISYPRDVTPVKTQWVLSAATNGTTYTVNSDYTGENSIPNLLMQKVSIRVRKLGYNVATPDTQYPLEGVVIGIYNAANALIASGTTDEYGYVSFQLDPNTSFYAKEITSIAGYEKNPNKFSFITGDYGTTLPDQVITDAEYRKLTLVKKDVEGSVVPGAVFEIKKSTGGQIVDSNGVAIEEDTLTTDASGQASILLPAGTYRVDELSVGGTALTDTEKAYFKLANPSASAYVMTASGTGEFVLELTNPEKGALDISKADDLLVAMADVPFAVQFKAFSSLTESKPLATNPGFSATGDWLSFAGSATWTTGIDGTIHKTGLLPGWYKLTEAVPEGYVSAGVTPFIVKVTANGLGQTNDDAATLNVTNVRKGYVTLAKTFAGSVSAWPQSVTFQIYKDSALTTAADPASVTLSTADGTGETTFMLDPGTYYVREATDSWYGRYAVGSGEDQWVNGAFSITVTSDNLSSNAVLASVENHPKTASVTLKKVDDSATPGPVEGASFAIYYLNDAQEKVYLASPVSTASDGTATLTVTLPLARVILDETAYYLEELSAPAQYELADPVELTLTPGASVSWTDAADLTIVDETALVIGLTKYARTRENIAADSAATTLAGATFELYRADPAAGTGEFIASATTGADGLIQFGNLPKLTGTEGYYLRESAVPTGYVSGSLQLYAGEALLSAESVAIGANTLSIYPVAQDENFVTLAGYNTPKGSIAVLKYNYIDPKNSAAVPLNATFAVRDDQGDLVGTVQVGQHLSTYPASLDGGSVTYTSGTYYQGGDGTYYSSAVLKNLEPGQYTVTETAAATGFLLPTGTTSSDPWHTVASVTVGDDGVAAVVYFANLPNTSVTSAIEKSVYAVNGVLTGGEAAQIDGSLQDGPQTLTFQISNIASTSSNLFMLPIEQLILKDDTLSFTGRNASGQTVAIEVAHYITSLTVGKAYYIATPVSGVPTGDAAKVSAKVYGMAAGVATLLSTVDVTGVDRQVAFPAESYDGFQVVYTAGAGGASLRPGFALDPVTVEMSFAQDDASDVVPALEIKNTANAKVTFKIGDTQYDSGWKDSTTAVAVVPDDELPSASIAKSVLKLEIVNNVRVPAASQPSPITVQPGDWVRYTLTLTNTSDLPIPNPVIIDKLPAMLSVDLADVSFSTTSSGLTADAASSFTDAGGVVYVYRNLTGALEPGQTATLIIDGMVRYSSAASNPGVIENVCYAASTDKLSKNVLNPYGTPFTDASGLWPAHLVDGSVLGGTAGETYQALSATNAINLVETTELKIYKMVAADESGLGNYTSNDEYAIASVRDGEEDHGEILYRIVIVNGGTNPVEDVRVVDKLPVIGDTSLSGSSRLSKWPVEFDSILSAVDGNGDPVYYSLYSTTGKTNAEYWSAIQHGPTGWSSGAGSDAKAILLDFSQTSGADPYTLEPSGKIIITYRAWAPSESLGEATLDGYYFEASVNDAAAAVDTYSTAGSGPAKVVLMPASVGAGNRVWIDKNANGVQDGSDIDDPASLTGEPSYTGGGITISLLKYFNSDSNASVAGSVSLGADGFFRFDGLTPAMLKSGVVEDDAYDAVGNVLNAKLKGSGRTAYQLKVTGVPAGYLVTSPFALTGGAAPNHEALSARVVDSNFTKSGEAYLSERFYLPIDGDDLTYDLGLIRVRDLEIQKRGTDNRALSGVQFKIYGPFTDWQLASNAEVSGENEIATLTTDASGKASFVSAGSLYLNYYENYVVVETVAAQHYDAAQLTVSGGAPAATSSYTVTGDGISGTNYFVLPAKSGEEAYKDVVVATNQYVASGSTTLSGFKELTGRQLAAGDFTFRLTDVTDPENPVSVTASNDAFGDFSFDLSYDLADIGIHTYQVTEEDGGLANHDYDDTVFTVTVTVTDSNLHDGVLNIEKAVAFTDATHAGEPAEGVLFSNRYAATAEVPLSGTKELTGRALEAGEFAFQLYEETLDGPQLIQTAFSGADGAFSFEPLLFDQDDIGMTYVYTLMEAPSAGPHGSLPNHTYDNAVYAITVTVGYDDSTGELTTEVHRSSALMRMVAAQDVDLEFTNAYAATAEVPLSGTKELTGRALEAGEFAFRLYEVGQEGSTLIQTAYNGADGAFGFTPLEYDQEDIGKTYTYRVSEDPGAGSHGSLPNHTYDATAYTVTVAVGYDEETGELTTAVATDVDGQQHTPEDEPLAFENAYAATAEVPLSGTKELTGRALEAGEFAFRLYEVGQEGSTLIQTAYNGADGAFGFTPLEYDQEDIGRTYTYRVSEDPGAGSHGSLPNHTYDATAYTVTVAVGYDEETGELTTAVATDVDGQQHTPEDEPLAFENAYAAETSVALSGTKALTGRVIEDGNFSFKLTDVTDSAHPVDIETASNAGNAFGFAALGYDEGDIGATYTYQVRELNGGVGGYTYDAAVYTVAVTVGYDSATGLLTTRIETYKDGAQAPQADNVLAFSNAYEAVGGYTPVGTKALEGRSLMDGMFRFEVRDEEGALAASGVSDASGATDFTEIVYQKNAIRDDTGAHTYTISEITGNDQGIDDAGVVYSAQTFGLTVVVTDNGDGTLSAEAAYPDGAAAFENGIEKVIVEGRKIWSDQSDLYGERPDSVTVYLLADGARIDSRTLSGSGNEWSYRFQDLPRYRYDDPYNAVEIAYTVDESAVSGYHKYIAEASVSSDENGGRVIGYDITNVLRQFSVTKRTAGGARLAGATLALYRVQNGARTLIESWRTSAASDHVVSGLEAGSYLLVETAAPDGYLQAANIQITIAEDGTVTSGALTAVGVVRMIDELIPTADVSGTKTWVDLNNQSGQRPGSIQITLYADGVAVDAQPIWVRSGDVWSYTYAGLPIYRSGASGARIVYTVEEAPVDGYEARYDALNITNQLVNVEIKYTEILGQKTWVDDNDAAGARPDSITVYLLRNGEVIRRVEVSERDGWAYSFSDLPTSDGATTEYTYAVNEKSVPGYARSVRNYNLTNTYVSTKEPPEEPKKPTYTPETWEELVTLLDPEVPLYGGLLKTGEEIPVYPFVFGALGLTALLTVLIADRRKRRAKKK